MTGYPAHPPLIGLAVGTHERTRPSGKNVVHTHDLTEQTPTIQRDLYWA